MTLSSLQRTALAERLDFVSTELADLRGYHDMTWDAYITDRTSRRNVERIIENVGNAVVDMAKIILVAQDLPVPSTYREVVRSVAAVAPFPPDDVDRLAELATLRNALAHRYLDYKWEGIRRFIAENHEVVRRFLDWVNSLIDPGGTGQPRS